MAFIANAILDDNIGRTIVSQLRLGENCVKFLCQICNYVSTDIPKSFVIFYFSPLDFASSMNLQFRRTDYNSLFNLGPKCFLFHLIEPHKMKLIFPIQLMRKFSALYTWVCWCTVLGLEHKTKSQTNNQPKTPTLIVQIKWANNIIKVVIIPAPIINQANNHDAQTQTV